MPAVKVLIADDHAHVLEHLVNLLKDRFDVVGTVNHGNLLIDATVRLRPDVVVTDVSMPGLSGLEAVRLLRAARPEAKVIVLTMYAEAELAAEAMRLGATGFVQKHAAVQQLPTAIMEALEGRVYLAPAIAKDVLGKMSDTESA
jgi:DNA-binding NarL/FixJ family response regulator